MFSIHVINHFYLAQVLLFCSFYHTVSPPGGQTPYPSWAKAIGWLVSAVPTVFLPVGIILKVLHFSRKQNLFQVFDHFYLLFTALKILESVVKELYLFISTIVPFV
jgi:hypothetical protein